MWVGKNDRKEVHSCLKHIYRNQFRNVGGEYENKYKYLMKYSVLFTMYS